MSTGALLGHALGGTVEHTVSNDGLLLISVYTSPDGDTVTGRVTWRDRQTAEENYANAQRSFEDRVVAHFAPKLSNPAHDGDRHRAWKRQTWLGTAYLGLATGSSTRLRPRVKVRLRRNGEPSPLVAVGWLHATAYLRLAPARRRTAT